MFHELPGCQERLAEQLWNPGDVSHSVELNVGYKSWIRSHQ